MELYLLSPPQNGWLLKHSWTAANPSAVKHAHRSALTLNPNPINTQPRRKETAGERWGDRVGRSDVCPFIYLFGLSFFSGFLLNSLNLGLTVSVCNPAKCKNDVAYKSIRRTHSSQPFISVWPHSVRINLNKTNTDCYLKSQPTLLD